MVQTRLQKKKKGKRGKAPKKAEYDPSSSDESLSECSDDISVYESDSTQSEESEEEVLMGGNDSVYFYRKRESIQQQLDQDLKSAAMFESSWGSNTRANNLAAQFQPRVNRPRTRSMDDEKKSKGRKDKRSNKNSNKRKRNKDDSDNSDIDLDNCSSAEEDPDYTESDAYQNFVSEVVESMVDEAHDQIQIKKAYLRAKKWKKDLSQRDIKKYEHEYNEICDVISVMPTIQDILKVDMPFKTKCDLMEKLIILDNAPPDTFEHLGLKISIRDEIEKYQKSNLNKRIYQKYNDIERELEESDYVDLPLKYKILGSEMSFSNKVAVYRKYKYWITLNEHSSEHPKLLNWIQTSIDLPHKITALPVSISDENNVIAKFLYDVKYKLNISIYGMDHVKEQILCILNNKITNPNLVGCAIALAGVQGSGKTKLIQALAEAIDIPFTSIPLGGATDSGHLQGHGFTYEGSRPGAVVDALIKMRSLSGIIFFDEIDKISTTRYGQEISKCLLHITDFTQNHEFTDKYLGNEIKINLSNMWFIYSLNYADLIDKTLADRIPIIKVDGYNKKQKKELAIRYLLPEAIKNINLDKGSITISDTALEYLVNETDKLYDHTTRDKNGNSGVRKLKDAIHNLAMKVNFLRNTIINGEYGNLKISFAIKDFKLPFVIEREHIDAMKILSKDENSTPMHMYL